MSDPLLAAQHRLTDRDLVLFGWLAEHKTLTTAQIAHALFPSPRFAQERLLTLTRARLLTRFRPYRNEGGTHPYHYLLDQLGEDIVAVQQDPDTDRRVRRDQARRNRWYLTNRANLHHLLAVNQFFTDLLGYARTHPGHHLERWWSSAHCQQPTTFADLNLTHWTHLHGVTIAADGHGIWTTNPMAATAATAATMSGRAATAALMAATVRVPFFLEVDLGTEDHIRLRAKLGAYETFTARTGHTWPVLFWFTSSLRERHFHQRLDRQPTTVPVATTANDRLQQATASVAEDVWWLHPRHPDTDDVPSAGDGLTAGAGRLLTLSQLHATVHETPLQP